MKKPVPRKKYKVVIEPHNNWFYIDWRGLIEYRDLLYFMVRRDFIAKYKQTILGPTWFVLQPLLMTLVFTVIFGKAIKVPTDGLPPVLFYLCGLPVWNYFSSTFTGVANSLVSNAKILTKVYFPRTIIPISIVFSNFFTFLLQLGTFLVFYVYFKFLTPVGDTLIDINKAVLLLPLLLFESILLSIGLGLLIAGLTVKYRDLQYLVGFIVQLWMYATPLIYPMSAIPEKYRAFIFLNPLASIVESYRFAFLGTGYFNVGSLFLSFCSAGLVLIVGIVVFSRVERTFVDTI